MTLSRAIYLCSVIKERLQRESEPLNSRKNENPKSYETRNFSKDLESQIKNGN